MIVRGGGGGGVIKRTVAWNGLLIKFLISKITNKIQVYKHITCTNILETIFEKLLTVAGWDVQ